MSLLGKTIELWITNNGVFVDQYNVRRHHKLSMKVIGVTDDDSYDPSVCVEAELSPSYFMSADLVIKWKRDRYKFCDDIASYMGKPVTWVRTSVIHDDNRNMTLDHFLNFAPEVYQRYLMPEIRMRNIAASALRDCVNDPHITEAEKAALKNYAALEKGVVPSLEANYSWCAQCMKMIGAAEHFHCPSCRGPYMMANKCSRCENCRGCCDCAPCRSCHEPMRDAPGQPIVSCPNCGVCPTCCRCVPCTNMCGRMSTCGGCTRCQYCCACQGVSYNAGEPWLAESLKDRKVFNCKRLVGVEWEYNLAAGGTGPNSHLGRWARNWRAGLHRDGSCGMEAVTPPIAGDHIVKCLTALGTAFTTTNAVIDTRCSIHVHVDARDYHWIDIYRLLKLHAHIEPALFILAGQNRVDSRFCKPCGKAYLKALRSFDKKDAIIGIALAEPGRQGQRKKPGKRAHGRYRSLNICPWLAGRYKKARDITVEYRLHRNSSDANQVIGWAKLCARIIDWTIKASDKDVDNLPKSSIRSLMIIAPDCKEWIIKGLRDWRKACVTRANRKVKFTDGKYLIAA